MKTQAGLTMRAHCYRWCWNCYFKTLAWFSTPRGWGVWTQYPEGDSAASFALEKQVSGKLCGHENPLASISVPFFSGTSKCIPGHSHFSHFKVSPSHALKLLRHTPICLTCWKLDFYNLINPLSSNLARKCSDKNSSGWVSAPWWR